MKKIVISSIALFACTSMLYASGYRIPEQSFASTAKSGANIAVTNGADAAYYNPANMAFLSDKSHMEFALTYINLPKIKYIDAQNPMLNSKSKVEHFLAPTFHYASPEVFENTRFGVAFVAPGGLAKRWDDFYAKATAEEFSLKILELNPSVSYQLSDNFALGLGARMTYIDGTVKSHLVRPINGQNMIFSRELTGDSIDFGYNLALTYKPIENLTISSTYRSKVDLTVKGDATLKGGLLQKPSVYDGGAGITIPLPASFDLALAYDFGKTKVELVYERTFWSSYKALDFFYDQDLTKNPLLAAFDNPKPRDWEDVNAYRIGITHSLTDKLDILAGFAYDETPATHDEYLGFELPDSDAMLYSLGASYDINNDMSIAFSYLYDKKKKRVISNRTKQDPSAINGTFKDASAHLVNMSLEYRF
ncbi:MAG: aromatic hydrocarbon degradation protein [Proteobacteria bacterium]|nr:MAG: aromatic hydrocarbon degradation protein [Pseudomonadota bacterium]